VPFRHLVANLSARLGGDNLGRWVLIGLGSVLLVRALRRLRFDWGLVGIILGGVAVYLGYWGYTTALDRNYDAPQQLKYIESILREGHAPTFSPCVICHHPPLYYWVAAGWLRVLGPTHLASSERLLQLLSLGLFLGFIVFAVLIARRFARRRAELYLASALIVFWPYSIINSVRVHNDSLVSPLMAAAMYFMVKWYEDEQRKDLWWAAAMVGLGLLTKSSAYVLVICLLVLVSAKLGRQLVTRARSREGWKQRVQALISAGVALGILAGSAALSAWSKHGPRPRSWQESLLGGAWDVRRRASQLRLGNGIGNYVCFDLREILSQPFHLDRNPPLESQCFWDSLLKSSLFGTYNVVPDPELGYALNRKLALLLSVLLLAMVLCTLAGVLSLTREQAKREGILWGIGLAFVMSLAFFRSLVPYPHHADFRHAFPLLIPACVLFSASLERFCPRRRAAYRVGFMLAGAFILVSILLLAPKQHWLRKLTDHVIERPLSAYARVLPAGTSSREPGILRLAEYEVVAFRTPPDTLVSRVDLSVDHDDQYEIEVVGADECRRVLVGPILTRVPGLARYTEELRPPVRNVREIRVRPVQGDGNYALGHLLVPLAEAGID
jgi:4-amino-4-deoxy-L-arabinose transferase-like glycosyltransferase